MLLRSCGFPMPISEPASPHSLVEAGQLILAIFVRGKQNPSVISSTHELKKSWWETCLNDKFTKGRIRRKKRVS